MRLSGAATASDFKRRKIIVRFGVSSQDAARRSTANYEYKRVLREEGERKTEGFSSLGEETRCGETRLSGCASEPRDFRNAGRRSEDGGLRARASTLQGTYAESLNMYVFRK